MSVIDMLLDLFQDEDEQAEFQEDPAGYLDEHGPEGLTAEDILAAMPGVCAGLPPDQADAVRAAYGLPGAGGSGGGAAQAAAGTASQAVATHAATAPAPPTPDPGGDPLEQVLEQINYFTTVTNVTHQSFEDNDVTNIDDRDTTVDNSVNQDITAFGDVTQDFDNDVVSGDGAVAAGDGLAGQHRRRGRPGRREHHGRDIATGDVEGSVTGDVDDSIVGDDNQVIADSTVGAASFGEGDATNVSAGNANLGDGTIVDDVSGDATLNQGDGDLTQIEGSTIEESAIGAGGTVQSNDIDIDADDGSSVAFGDGASSSAETQDLDVDGNSGTIQLADEGDQTAATDNSINDSFDTEGSYNTDLVDTDNSINDSFDIEGSANDDHSFTDNSVDTTVNGGDTIVDGGLLSRPGPPAGPAVPGAPGNRGTVEGHKELLRWRGTPTPVNGPRPSGRHCR